MIDKKMIQIWAESQNLTPLYYGTNPSLVIFGEDSKTNQEQRKQQEDLIELLKSPELLAEGFEKGTYDPHTQTFYDRDTGETRDYSTKTNPQIDLSNKHKIILTGCDVTYREYDEIHDRLSQEDPDLQEDPDSFIKDRVCEERQLIMGQNITDRVLNSNGPVLARISAYNMRPKSKIHAILQDNDIDYVCIDQTGRYTEQEGE